MPQRLKQYETPESFIKSLEVKTKSCFTSANFRAEAYRECDKTNQREYKLKFFEKVGDAWVSFGFIISPYRKHLIEALKEELKIYCA